MPALSDEVLLVSHAAVTWALAGLIWTIQVVQYPLFARVDAESFARFHAEYTMRIAWLVAPAMPLEAVLAAWLLARAPAAVPGWMTIAGAALVVAIWATTAWVQVPQHARLARGRDAQAVSRLVRGNWIRTLAWSARGLLALGMLLAGAKHG